MGCSSHFPPVHHSGCTDFPLYNSCAYPAFVMCMKIGQKGMHVVVNSALALALQILLGKTVAQSAAALLLSL